MQSIPILFTGWWRGEIRDELDKPSDTTHSPAQQPMKSPLSLAWAALLATACHKSDLPAPSNAATAPVPVHLTPATLESHQAIEDVVGTVRSKQQAVIEAKVSGRLVQYLATPGQSVKAGELLAELDVQEIRAKLEQAKAMLEQAMRDLGRQQQLIASKATSQQELDAAAARVKVTTAGVSEAETMLGYAKVTAPFDGVITRKLADVGDLAMPGKPLMEIESPAHLRFETDLPESLLDRVRTGAKLPVTIPTLTQPLAGTVSEISPVADPVSRTFLVKLDLPDDPGLRPGQFGRVAVPVAQTELLLVPRQAVLRRGQIEAVFVVRGTRASLRLVKTGKAIADKTEILSGLEPGDAVVTDDASRLTDGQSVTAQP